ncbi:MAG: serpin [Frankiales bacterium]|nr:serpin [Frankiales bacterium]
MRSRTVAVTAVTLLVAACGQTKSAAPQAVPTHLAGNVEQLQRGTLTARDVSAAQQRFGLELMAKVCGADGPNTLVSPASAADALGLLDASAGGGTAKAMATLLHLPVWGPAVVAAVHDHRVLLDRLATGKDDTLRTSNRVWPAAGNQPTPQYLDDVRTAYGATLQTLDYLHHATQATDTINEQVGKDTDGLIPKLFDQPVEPQTSAVLTNAIVLKAMWREPFLLRQAKSPFTTGDGAKQVWLMDSAKSAGYSSAGGWQAAQIPYRSGTLQAVAILPPIGTKACALPTVAELRALTASPAGRTSVALPQLHLDQTHDLLKTLGQMGLPLVGDYSGLGGSIISKVVQKDVMTVDELGTVAAGATGIAMESSAEAQPEHSLSFDRPFLLLLEDVATHTPLFLASVGDPSLT